MSDVSVGVAYLDIVPRLSKTFGKQVEGSLAKTTTGKVIQNTAKVGAALTAGITIPLLGLGKAAISSFENYDVAVKKFAASTGVHGKQLAKDATAMKQIFSSTIFDYPTIEAGLAKVVQRFDVTGGHAKSLTRKFLDLGKVTGEDVPGLVDLSSKALKAFNVPAKNTGALIDYIFRASQQSGVPFSELAQGALSAQVPIRAMGLSLKQGIALVAQLNSLGIAPTAIKGISTYIGKLTAPDAVSKLQDSLAGTKGADRRAIQDQIALARTAKNNPLGALQQTFQSIKNAPNRNAALGIAAKAFGARSGGLLVTPIRSGKLDPKAFADSVGKGDATPEKAAKGLLTFSDSITILQHKVATALAPLGKTLIEVFKSMTPILKDVIGWIKSVAKSFSDMSPSGKRLVVIIGLLAAALGPMLIVLAGLAASIAAISLPVTLVVVGIAALAAGFIYLYTHTKWLPKIIQAAWNIIKHAFRNGVKVVMDIIKVFVAVFHGRWAKAWHGIVTIVKLVGPMLWKAVQGLWNLIVKAYVLEWHMLLTFLKAFPGNVIKLIKGWYSLLWHAAQGFWNLIVKGAVGMWHKLLPWLKRLPGNIVHALAGIGRAMFNFGKSIVSWIVKGIGSAPASIGKAIESKLPSWARGAAGIVGSGLGTALKALPFAEGGDVQPGQLAMVGERGPELAVFPRGARIVAHNQLAQSLGGGGQTVNHFHIKSHDPHGVAREVHKIMNRDGERQANHDKWANRKFVG